METSKHPSNDPDQDRPIFFRSWSSLYIFLGCYNAAILLLLYLFSLIFDYRVP